jgi:hypothetical protein
MIRRGFTYLPLFRCHAANRSLGAAENRPCPSGPGYPWKILGIYAFETSFILLAMGLECLFFQKEVADVTRGVYPLLLHLLSMNSIAMIVSCAAASILLCEFKSFFFQLFFVLVLYLSLGLRPQGRNPFAYIREVADMHARENYYFLLFSGAILFVTIVFLFFLKRKKLEKGLNNPAASMGFIGTSYVLVLPFIFLIHLDYRNILYLPFYSRAVFFIVGLFQMLASSRRRTHSAIYSEEESSSFLGMARGLLLYSLVGLVSSGFIFLSSAGFALALAHPGAARPFVNFHLSLGCSLIPILLLLLLGIPLSCVRQKLLARLSLPLLLPGFLLSLTPLLLSPLRNQIADLITGGTSNG